LPNSISYTEYEKIVNRDSTKVIFDSLRMTHEGNQLVKKTKAPALIKKYVSFKMEEMKTLRKYFQDFRLSGCIGLRVLNKWYTTSC
jgi:hypothetical protein